MKPIFKATPDLWLTALPKEQDLPDLLAGMPQSWKEHILSYTSSKRQHQSAGAWALLALMLKERGLQPDEVSFSDNGKPSFVHLPLYFSLSHDGGYAACLLSELPCGLDLQHFCLPHHPKLQKQLGLKEQQCLKDEQLLSSEFARIWTRKEAIIKLLDLSITSIRNIDPKTDAVCSVPYENLWISWISARPESVELKASWNESAPWKETSHSGNLKTARSGGGLIFPISKASARDRIRNMEQPQLSGCRKDEGMKEYDN